MKQAEIDQSSPEAFFSMVLTKLYLDFEIWEIEILPIFF